MAGARVVAVVLVAAAAFGGAPKPKKPGPQFQSSDRCVGCHNGLTTSAGEDISIGFDWRATMMANSSRDPYWQAGVRREVMDHPASKAEIEDECAKCHMPMARYQAHLGGREGEVFAKLSDGLAADGVSCSLCHQIGKSKLGTRESFVGGFVIDPPTAEGERPEYGPFKIEDGLARVMRSSSRGFRPTEASHVRESEMCATCHTLITKALGPGGKVIAEFPEQVPYQEWQHSEFRQKKSCQACHMPVVKEEVAITNVLGTPREGVSRHVFVGGNFFMLRMLNKYRGDLSVAALAPEMEAAADRTAKHLQSETARVAVSGVAVNGGRLEFDVAVENLGGHKLPTAYPSRRAWLHVTVRDRNGRTVFESGAVNSSGAIQGADGDDDGKRFEPHYSEIRTADQVQIYESVMSDSAGATTTALLQAVRYLKDNRLLPRGFDKRSADKEIAVVGGAADDADFAGGGDRVRYSVAPAGAEGPLQIEAELLFQPIAYRWAANLKAYDAAETKRFTTYYDSMSASSWVKLAGARTQYP